MNITKCPATEAFKLIDSYFTNRHATLWRDEELKGVNHPERIRVVNRFVDELIAVGLVFEDRDAEYCCESCDVTIPNGVCERSQRVCRHHCNHYLDGLLCHFCEKGAIEDDESGNEDLHPA